MCKENMDMEQISISVVGGGNSAFLRAFTIPLAEDLEKIEGFGNKPIPDKGVMEVDSRPKACDLPTIGFFGVLLFIPGWFAKKVLEELYEIKIRPAVRRIIKEADKIELFSSSKKSKVFTLQVFHEQSNVLLVLAAKEPSLRELASATSELPTLIPSAIQRIEQYGSENEVHLYVLSGGKVNAIPLIHRNLELALCQLNT
jgi:hypothetical protein